MLKIANTLRCLSIDMIHQAQSGHLGIALGIADVVAVLFCNHFRRNDNFVLSAGHGSALLYSILYMRGVMSMNDLKSFRRSYRAPGHPEYGLPGIDSTTGPLGQGIASGVGIAIADKENKTYILAGDGCLMEGIGYEAIAIAGNLKLSNLVLLWDNNNITIDGKASLSRKENVCQIFQACNWNVIEIDGHDFSEIDNSIQQYSDKPLMIACKTIPGKYSRYENNYISHSKILTHEEIIETKTQMNCSLKAFDIDQEIYTQFPKLPAKQRNVPMISFQYSTDHALDNRATREYVTDILNMLDRKEIICGSADLALSTYMKCDINYGTREHGMIGIMNGIAISGKLPISSTFLSFIDYGRAAIRIAALSKIRIIIFATHDSVLIGEDGPTHQPIEHLMSYRIIPNTLVFRPYDLNEMIASMKIALKHNGPSIFALSRQKVSRSIAGEINTDKPYIISDDQNAIVDIYSSGSDIAIAIEVQKLLQQDGIRTRVISCFILHHQINIKNKSPYSISIELGSKFGWKEYDIGYVVGLDSFGISNSSENIIKHFKLKPLDIYNQVKDHYLFSLYQK